MKKSLIFLNPPLTCHLFLKSLVYKIDFWIWFLVNFKFDFTACVIYKVPPRVAWIAKRPLRRAYAVFCEWRIMLNKETFWFSHPNPPVASHLFGKSSESIWNLVLRILKIIHIAEIRGWISFKLSQIMSQKNSQKIHIYQYLWNQVCGFDFGLDRKSLRTPTASVASSMSPVNSRTTLDGPTDVSTCLTTNFTTAGLWIWFWLG